MLQIIKIIYRLFKYKAEWRKQFREIKIRRHQKEIIKYFDSKTEKLIIFLIPGAEYYSGKENITGGLISIISLAQETTKIFKGSDTITLCSTYYNNHLIYKITSFENQTKILSTNVIEQYFKSVKSLIIHIPELFVKDFVDMQLRNKWLLSIQKIQINILNQNIQLMPEDSIIQRLKGIYKNCTITTAHKKYCNAELRKKYAVPVHQLSVWISPENYQKVKFEDKVNLILFSPDNKYLTDQIITYLKGKLIGHNFQIINGLSYEAYKKLISIAKFVITTGEGLDSYFIETYFSGGVAFAVKNLNFFDSKYLDLNCLFNVEENIEEKIFNLIIDYNDIVNYKNLNNQVHTLLSLDYSYTTYQNNLKNFYLKAYTYG